jgi:hypothetical protein
MRCTGTVWSGRFCQASLGSVLTTASDEADSLSRDRVEIHLAVSIGLSANGSDERHALAE